jgi:hypothetical protein
VKSSSHLIEQMQDNSNYKLYLYCQPISSAQPQDLPEVEKILQDFWSAKLMRQYKNETISISEWFSIPKKDIHKILKNRPYGPCFIMLNERSNEDTTILFSNSKPIFKIKNNITREATKWVQNQK